MIDSWDLAFILVIAIVTTNFISLAVFYLDKQKSRKGSWRIPESKLLLVAFFGPFGAYAGIQIFKHKKHKLKFLPVPFFAVLQAALIIYFYFFSSIALFPIF